MSILPWRSRKNRTRRYILEQLEQRIVLDASVDKTDQDNPDNTDNNRFPGDGGHRIPGAELALVEQLSYGLNNRGAVSAGVVGGVRSQRLYPILA